jgi:hypothetical protein
MSDNDDKTVPLEPIADVSVPEATVPDATVPEATIPDATPAAPAAPAPTAPAPTPWSITITTDASAVRTAHPRTRWAAIVWGLIIAGIAATILAIVGSPERRQVVSDWAATLTPGAFWILSALVVGAFILVLAVLALIRRAQRRSSVV